MHRELLAAFAVFQAFGCSSDEESGDKDSNLGSATSDASSADEESSVPDASPGDVADTPAACAMPDVVDFISSPSAQDCGVLDANASGADRAALIDCVRAASSAHQPFKAILGYVGADSVGPRAFVGTGPSQDFITYQFDVDNIYRDTTSWWACQHFAVQPGCADGVECVTCEVTKPYVCFCKQTLNAGPTTTFCEQF